jgi:alpha-amylase
MWPGDLEAIFGRLHNLNTEHGFPPNSKPFMFHEVIYMGGEGPNPDQYKHLGKVTEFRYGNQLGDVVRKNNGQQMKYLNNFGMGWGFLPDDDALIFTNNHDNQRGHGAGGFTSVVTFFESRLMKMATSFMLAWPYGTPRVMSSYNWPRYIQDDKDVNDGVGPPSDGDQIKSVTINDDMTCGNGWICEHR